MLVQHVYACEVSLSRLKCLKSAELTLNIARAPFAPLTGYIAAFAKLVQIAVEVVAMGSLYPACERKVQDSQKALQILSFSLVSEKC